MKAGDFQKNSGFKFWIQNLLSENSDSKNQLNFDLTRGRDIPWEQKQMNAIGTILIRISLPKKKTKK
jgi:hypothetical protein